MNRLFKINDNDNVAVALQELKAGYQENGIILADDIPFGHKVSLADINCGESIIKYGSPIGKASCIIKKGSHIHSHNLKTSLSEKAEYKYAENNNRYSPIKSDFTFMGYRRENGSVAVRNDIWIIPTVGCVNKTAERLCEFGRKLAGKNCTDVKALTHPYGCSQMGGDMLYTQKLLSSLVNHPNAGGVLVLSLGCENNNLSVFKSFLGKINDKRVKFLVAQNEEDELDKGKQLLTELLNYVDKFEREPLSVDKLVVGYKCGGSDAFSGITANALCGRLTDRLTAMGASALLTEVPEMFGAEHILMKRAENKRVFNDIVKLISSFKSYFISHNQTVYENPSPGNKEGGITTLEEKSLGCVQKGGSAVITDVLDYAQPCSKRGLNLLYGPGNDIVSATNLTAAGAHIILFTTGRGTPLGAPVPTIKISSNTPLYDRKRNWIDFNAGDLIENASFEEKTEKLFQLLIEVASGEKTNNEKNGYSEIAVFKDGVIM